MNMGVAANRPVAGICFMLIGLFCISLNDMLIKALSGGYPLHQLVFLRTGIGILISVVILQFEGGAAALRTGRAGLHLLRAGLVVFANLSFYAALVAMPLAMASALYFVAPLFVTLLSIPVLGERVGPRRFVAILAGLLGVSLILHPELARVEDGIGWVVILPVLSAAGYAGMSVLTRKLGGGSRASAMAIYLQVAFLLVSLTFWAVAGDGRFAPGPQGDASLDFLLRAWVRPPAGDWPEIAALGVCSGLIGYCMSQAYRLAPASAVAPFEYALLPLAAFWGWAVFGEIPGARVLLGAAIIAAAGLYVFARENRGRRNRSPGA